MSNWQIEFKPKTQNLKLKTDELIKILLENRGVFKQSDIDEFLNPSLTNVNPKEVGINIIELKKSVKRIKKAIEAKEKIIVYGDYDVDGVCASAILWETLNTLKADVMPFIPSRFEEGYGLSKEGIDVLLAKQNASLIITVDNGIVANEAVSYANKKNIDIIITDHHTPSTNLPNAHSIVHTTNLCGAGVAYLLSKELIIQNSELKIEQDEHLSLVALATIADLVSLTKANRNLVFFGIKALRNTKRPGLLALFQKAGLKQEEIGVYEIGHMIAPRLNAMGRLESATDSLRLICTSNKIRAEQLATLLTDTNFQRQQITSKALENAKSKVGKKVLKKLIFISSEDYQQGIVGLVAGRLVEEYYLPTIVVSKGEKLSKASARSIKGFNITEFLRSAKDLLVDVGGHPMAAGFTVETEKIQELEERLLVQIEKMLDVKNLEKSLRVDTELPQNLITKEFYQSLQVLYPFGMGNPEPTFLTKGLIINSLRTVGNDGKHLKLEFGSNNSEIKIPGIFFNGTKHKDLKVGDSIDVVYTLDENIWNGNSSMQLKVKDLKPL